MYYVKHRRGAGQRMRRRLAAVISLAAFFTAFITLNMQLRRIIEDAAQVHAQNAFSTAVSRAVSDVLGDNNFELVHVNSTESGQIVSIETDTAQINSIKSQVSIIMIDKLRELSSQPITVSLGTLTGIEWLAGLGPRLEMRLELRGGVSTDIISDLRETGINQSLHTIDCVATADYYVILPGCRFSAQLSTTVPLAQSVVVGEVPDAYTYVVGDQSDTIGRIFDYGHQQP